MIPITKKDYLIGALVGLLTGILALRIFSFLRIDFGVGKIFFLFGIPILWALGVWLGGFLGKWVPFFNQFGKFAAVGFLSTSIDFFVLNLMSSLTGVTAGIIVGWINIPGFSVAILNGYLWNRFWVFKYHGDPNRPPAGGWGNFPKFLGVTFLGLFINSWVIIAITSFFSWPNPLWWLNIAKASATVISMVWNFIGYKYFAFSEIKSRIIN